MSDETVTVENVLPALEKTLGDLTFAKFEEAPKGEITISSSGFFKRTKFKMRVGLHLNRPTQVIIAEGCFVRMRAAPEYSDYELKVLDANKPDNCLYEQLVAEVGKPGLVKSAWRPNELYKSFRTMLSGFWKREKVISDDPTS